MEKKTNHLNQDLNRSLARGEEPLKTKEVKYMSGVRLRDGESFDSLLRRFRKVVTKDGILQDVKRIQFYEKPSERRRKELAAARRRMLRRMQKQQG